MSQPGCVSNTVNKPGDASVAANESTPIGPLEANPRKTRTMVMELGSPLPEAHRIRNRWPPADTTDWPALLEGK